MRSPRPPKFRVTVLSALRRRNYWSRHSSEQDASLLWPGIRSVIRQWLTGSFPIVVGAITGTGEPIVASRCVFMRSGTCRELWSYGYLYTRPEYRREGLALRVMTSGLEAIAAAGAKQCSCYVAEDNMASADLAVKLGFQKLPFVRVVILNEAPSLVHSAPHKFATVSVNLDSSPLKLEELLQSDAWGIGAPVVVDELSPPGRRRNWRSKGEELVRVTYEGTNVAFARISPSKVVFAANPDLVDQEHRARAVIGGFAIVGRSKAGGLRIPHETTRGSAGQKRDSIPRLRYLLACGSIAKLSYAKRTRARGGRGGAFR